MTEGGDGQAIQGRVCITGCRGRRRRARPPASPLLRVLRRSWVSELPLPAWSQPTAAS